ncbi:MAG: preprotein translocase subunit SecA, partial [Candidatus Neomarinimicrobiota bacterium]|nr:preprotein translocase subunit SecA [Candidatus Neomarinimicrobiota bacterium]
MVLAKLFGTKSERETKKLIPLIDEINQFCETLSLKSDEDLVNRTHEMREIVINSRVTKKESLPENLNRQEQKKAILKAEQDALDNIMVEAFAMVKETCRRMCGTSWRVSGHDTIWEMIPYDVQIMGAITLHRGKITEMKT